MQRGTSRWDRWNTLQRASPAAEKRTRVLPRPETHGRVGGERNCRLRTKPPTAVPSTPAWRKTSASIPKRQPKETDLKCTCSPLALSFVSSTAALRILHASRVLQLILWAPLLQHTQGVHDFSIIKTPLTKY